MWGGSGRRNERGSEGPILRDPKASRAQASLPYNKPKINPWNSWSNNNSFNNENGNIFNDGSVQFPPALDEAAFPPVPPLAQMSSTSPVFNQLQIFNQLAAAPAPQVNLPFQTSESFSAIVESSPVPRLNLQRQNTDNFNSGLSAQQVSLMNLAFQSNDNFSSAGLPPTATAPSPLLNFQTNSRGHFSSESPSAAHSSPVPLLNFQTQASRGNFSSESPTGVHSSPVPLLNFETQVSRGNFSSESPSEAYSPPAPAPLLNFETQVSRGNFSSESPSAAYSPPAPAPLLNFETRVSRGNFSSESPSAAYSSHSPAPLLNFQTHSPRGNFSSESPKTSSSPVPRMNFQNQQQNRSFNDRTTGFSGQQHNSYRGPNHNNTQPHWTLANSAEHSSSNFERVQSSMPHQRQSTFDQQDVEWTRPSFIESGRPFQRKHNSFDDGMSPASFNRRDSNNDFISSSMESQRPSPKPLFPIPGNKFQNASNMQKVPLLSTPKIVPYPPPPQVKSFLPPTAILRNPRGILKSSQPTYSTNFISEEKSASHSKSYSSNFVPEGKSSNREYAGSYRNSSRTISSNSSSGKTFTVVPYACGDDDEGDEDDDEDYVEGEISEPTHDFFSEKMVQHFSSLLNGKPLEQQLQELMTHLVLAPEYLTSRVNIVRNLHIMLNDSFKKCSLHPYGADFIGIGSSDDSVNIFVDLTGKQASTSTVESNTITPSDLSNENVEQFFRLIQEDENHKFFGQIVRRTSFYDSRANLPVFSFIHSDTQVRCNLRLDNYLLVQEAKVIQFICSLDTRIIPLLGLVRYWSSVHKVLDTPEEDTKNRFVTLLMLFFLSQKNIIPTMSHLQSLSVKHEYFENLDIAFSDDYSLVPKNENPALDDKTVFTLSTISLLKEFFKLFANTKFQNEVVSMWKAEFIPKENFTPNVEAKVLSPDLRKRYRFGADGKLRNKRIDSSSRLCIQDFQDLTENLSQSIASYDVDKFQLECEIALRKLETIMETGSGNLMDLFILTECRTVGTPEHMEMHENVYMLHKISENRKTTASATTIPQPVKEDDAVEIQE